MSLICAIGYGAYILYNSYLFNENGKIPDGHTDSINALKDVEDAEERKRQIMQERRKEVQKQSKKQQVRPENVKLTKKQKQKARKRKGDG